MKETNKYPDVTRFSDLQSRLSKAEQMIRVNNASAEVLFEQTGRIMPVYDIELAKRNIINEYKKYYGYGNKYSSGYIA